MATISERSRRNLATVDLHLQMVILKAIAAAPPWLDFGVIAGRRTTEEQNALWRRGRDATGKVIDKSQVVTYRDGYSRRSRHQDGDAIDIAAFTPDGAVTWDEAQVAIRAAFIVGFAAASNLRLTGGVEWGWDQGHIEVTK